MGTSSDAAQPAVTSAAQAPPQDSERVINAFRLGWVLAELKGRCRPGFEPVSEPPPGHRVESALPLGNERSESEQFIELLAGLTDLAKNVGVDRNLPPRLGTSPSSYCATFQRLSERARLTKSKKDWKELAAFTYVWDAHIQDWLVMDASVAAGYLLGRGLAETFWALDPKINNPEDWRSWQFLLGERRCRTLGRLAARLSSYVDPLTVPAITTSLDAWELFARDQQLTEFRTERITLAALYDQGLLWRDLVRGERKPEELVARRDAITRLGIMIPVVRALWPQILATAVGAGLLAFSGAELAAGGSTKTYTFVAVLSGLGITSTAAYTRAKGLATSLLTRLNTVYKRDAVGRAATLVPKPPPKHQLPVSLPARATPIDSASPRVTVAPQNGQAASRQRTAGRVVKPDGSAAPQPAPVPVVTGHR